MASKSSAVKRARFDAAAAAAASASGRATKDTKRVSASPAARRREAANAAGGDSAVAAVVVEEAAQLRTELESARRCVEQLRREKDYERRQVRDEEQARAAIALKDQAARLHTERQRDLEEARETARLRHEAETTKTARQHELAIRRLRDDLERVQNELREETEKRGVSTSVRAGFEAERARLIQKVADLGAAKRRLEEALQSATEADKQKAAEIRRLQDATKQEVARVSKDANAEIRKLLEELKAKDHQLALLDRNQYPDKGVGVGKLFQFSCSPVVSEPGPVLTCVKDVDVVPTKHPKSLPTESQNELLRSLRVEVDRLTGQLAASENDRTVLRARLEELRNDLAQRNDVIANLHSACQGKEKCVEVITEQELKQGVLSSKCQQKAVRFILPGLSLPVLARELSTCDETDSIASEVSDIASLSSSVSSVMSPDTTAFCDDNIEKSYHLLLTEHLQLQRSVALLLSSWNSPAQTSTATQPANSNTDTICKQDCHVKIESLKVAMETLKDKLNMCEEIERNLRQKLHEQLEQNEELEFRLLELEECAEKGKSASSDHSVSLDEEMSVLQVKLSKYKVLEKEFLTDCSGGSTLHDFITCLRQQRNDFENQLNVLKSELGIATDKLRGCKCGNLVEARLTDGEKITGLAGIEALTANVTDHEDDEKSCGVMTCSLSSATSGFDDHSCASSLAADDTRILDDDDDDDAGEMPSEETWGGFEAEDFCSSLNLAALTSTIEDLTSQADVIVTGRCQDTELQTKRDVEIIPTIDVKQHAAAEMLPLTEEALQVEKRSMLKRLEKLEKRLVHALEGEQRARDQLALMSEEKDRRIAALEDQVDHLEASEFRLSKTIETLEQLERAFSSHFMNSKSSTITLQSHLAAESSHNSVRHLTLDEDGTNSIDGTDDENQKSADGLDDSAIEIGHPCNDEDCTQCRACRTLQATIEQLHAAQREHADCDRRVRELADESTSTTEPETSPAAADGPVQIVDFEAEYREVEALVRELKKVLVVERQQVPERKLMNEEDARSEMSTSSASCTFARASSGRSSDLSSLSVGCSDWMVQDDDYSSCSMPVSPAGSDVESPVSMAMLSERNRELEITEQYLQQQISDLETERRQLRDLLQQNETTVRDLDIQVVELHGSEDTLRMDVTRLRAKEDWMNRRIDDLMELVGRLEDAVDGHRAADSELRSRLERHQNVEADLRRELENASEEQRAVEARYRRWVAQLEYEKETLIGRMEDLLDKNMELESREAALAVKVRKAELVELGLRSEIRDLEQAVRFAKGLELCEEQLLHGCPHKLGRTAAAVDADDDSEQQLARMRGVLSFMQQSLATSRRSNAALEAKLEECAAGEHLLRGTIAELQQIDGIWTEKTTALEASNAELAAKIRQLEESQRRFNLPQNDSRTTVAAAGSSSVADNSTTMKFSQNDDDDADFTQEKLNVSIEAAIKGIILLNDLADKADDTELKYWAAVEGGVPATITADDVVDDEVTSPFWADVEAHMGLNSETSTKEIFEGGRKETQQSATSSTTAATAPPPPPLPMSPPPAERGFDRDLVGTSTLSLDLLADDQSLKHRLGGDTKTSATVDADASPLRVSIVKIADGLKTNAAVTSTPALADRKVTVVSRRSSSSSSSSVRSRSADQFAAEPTTSLEQKRAWSEPREIVDERRQVNRADTTDHLYNQKNIQKRETSKPWSDEAAKSLTGVRERSNKARQFWSDMSNNPATVSTPVQTLITPSRPAPPPPLVPARPLSFRPSLIPRSTSRQLSVSSDDGGNTSPRSPVNMPVIRPTRTVVGVAEPAASAKVDGHPRSDRRGGARSPYMTVLTGNRSFIPRLVESPQADEKSTTLIVNDDNNGDSRSIGPTTYKSSYPFVSFQSPRNLRSDAAAPKLEQPSSNYLSSGTELPQHQQQQQAGTTATRHSDPAALGPGRRD